MPAIQVMPQSVRAVRVLLVIAGAVTLMTALSAWLIVGGALGFGVAVGLSLPAAASVFIALRIGDRPSRRLWFALLALEIVYFFWQFGRIADDDPFGLVGLCFPVAILILACRPASREYFRGAAR